MTRCEHDTHGSLTLCFVLFVLQTYRDDKWNGVLGSCGAGAVMRRAEGPAAMCQGCVSYGAFSVVIDMLVRISQPHVHAMMYILAQNMRK
jgi:hypothetical protein